MTFGLVSELQVDSAEIIVAWIGACSNLAARSRRVASLPFQ